MKYDLEDDIFNAGESVSILFANLKTHYPKTYACLLGKIMKMNPDFEGDLTSQYLQLQMHYVIRDIIEKEGE